MASRYWVPEKPDSPGTRRLESVYRKAQVQANTAYHAIAPVALAGLVLSSIPRRPRWSTHRPASPAPHGNSRGAHQLGAHSLCDRTRRWPGSLALLQGETLFFGQLTTTSLRARGWHCKCSKAIRVVCVWPSADSNRGAPGNRHAGSAGDKWIGATMF